MRLLLDHTGTYPPGTVLGTDQLADLYAPEARRWLRVNFVSTVDGAATGSDQRSGSINTDADQVVFELLRRLSDIVVVGAGTVRAEGYPSLQADDPRAPRLVVVSHSGAVPESVCGGPEGSVLFVTRENADPKALNRSRELLGPEFVLTAGRDDVDLLAMRHMLEDRGFRQILCEGGPALFGSMLEAGIVDELALTWSPKLVAGSHKSILSGPARDVMMAPLLLLEEGGSILGRWRVNP
ncbi:MAG TPA: dihydrofolate reductase family protein [Pedococcus sp.]|jgi:riboflavin biosynthesis pyrimidine reductase|nr:dihydrofolate reductase family protein [Pedococcus sp.]